MIKTLIFFAVLLAIAFGGAWLADRPGSILIEWPWLDMGFSVSLLVGFLLLVVAMALAVIAWVFFRGMWNTPRFISNIFTGRRRDQGYKALSTGMIAVGVGDLALARKQAAKARKLIGQEPMTLMLEAQTAQLAGEATRARQSFEAMLDNDETRALGRRGLYIEAQRRGDADEAMEMAKAATGDGKKTPGWAGSALFDMQTASGDWQGALVTLSQNHANKHVTKDEFRRSRAVILTAQAADIEVSDRNLQAMRPLLLEAAKLAPGLVPAATKGALVLNELKEFRKASKLIEAAWRVQPHPELADVYANIKNGETALDRLKRVRALYALMPDYVESRIALARASIDAREWAEARNMLEPLLEEHLTPRICMLMAELEEGENSDFGLVRQWLARAVGAHRDPVWIADGQVSDEWQPTSPVTGKLDVFEWKVPVLELAQTDQPVIDSTELNADDAESEEDLVLIPVNAESEPAPQPVEEPDIEDIDPEPSVEEASSDDADAVEEPEVEAVSEDPPVEAEPVAADTPVQPDAEPIEVVNGSATDDKPAKAEPKEVEFALPHAPDDPGPKQENGTKRPDDPGPKMGAEAHKREKRFRLF